MTPWLAVVLAVAASAADAQHAFHGRPNAAGLPAELPADYADREGFVFYDGIPGMEAIVANGSPKFVPEDARPSEVFSDAEAALLPPGERIRRRTNGAGQEFWDYPVGTRVIHVFHVNTSPRTLFELRLVQKFPDGTWSFGAYEPDADGRLRLRRRMERVVFDADVPRGRVRVDMNRLHPESCRLCHALHSPNNYQYRDEAHTGPCGFGPANPRLMTRWAPAYERRHGYRPFAN